MDGFSGIVISPDGCLRPLRRLDLYTPIWGICGVNVTSDPWPKWCRYCCAAPKHIHWGQKICEGLWWLNTPLLEVVVEYGEWVLWESRERWQKGQPVAKFVGYDESVAFTSHSPSVRWVLWKSKTKNERLAARVCWNLCLRIMIRKAERRYYSERWGWG